MNLTAHFTIEELTRSDYAVRHGLSNEPVFEARDNLYTLADGLERARAVLETPLLVLSGYRAPKVNAGVGGSKGSAHMRGLAADFVPLDVRSLREACEHLADHADFVDFDQLIHEGDWIHISFSDQPRHEVLTAMFGGGEPVYRKGLA